MTPLPFPWQKEHPAVGCLGLSALDYIWISDILPGATSAKVRASDFLVKGGGMAATAAVTAARLGAKTSFFGRAGQDAEGRMMRDELATEGVDVDCFRLFPEGRSSVSGIFVDASGERQIANFRGGNLPENPDWLPLGKIAGLDVILADPRWPEGAEAAFRAAREAGVPTVLDADMAESTVFDRLLPLTDHAVFSEPALASYAGSAEPSALEKIAELGCVVSAVTRGADGVLYRIHGENAHQPACPVEVADTTGAGDVFHGAYAYAIAAGASVPDTIAFAAAVAALKCTRADGRSGIPNLNASLSFWRKNI